MMACVAALVTGVAPRAQGIIPTEVPELRPGVLAGYLPRTALPDSLKLIPPPPTMGSALELADQEAYSASRALVGTHRDRATLGQQCNAMLEGVLDQGQQHHRWHHAITECHRNVDAHLEPSTHAHLMHGEERARTGRDPHPLHARRPLPLPEGEGYVFEGQHWQGRGGHST